MVTWWSLGVIGLLRVLRSAHDADRRCCQILAKITAGASSKVKLMVSPKIEQPFTFTWRRAVIVLPKTLCEHADPRHLRWALAHEWAHVRGRDALSWCLAGLARTLFFYQPFIWWLRRQLRLAQDYLADAEAAGQAPCPEDYAEFLTTWVAAHSRRACPVGLGIGGRRSELYRRIVMLVEPRRPLETRCPLVWRLAAASGVLLLVTVTATCQDAAKPPQPMDLNIKITEDRSTAHAATLDARAPSRDAEVQRLIHAVLARSTAIKSGVFVFAEIFDKIDLPPGLPDGEPLWRCSFSGESWAIRIPPRVHVVNHDGRFMSLSLPEQGRTSLTIQPPGTWRGKHHEFPIHVGTIEYESTRKFLREHSDRARLKEGPKVDDLQTRILELSVGPTELNAFGFFTDMFKHGGTLRLYVAEQLGGVLPRIEYVDGFGTVQFTFHASDFREVAPGIYFPYHFDDAAVKRIDFSKVEQVNEELPATEFVIAPIPAATYVADERPKSTDKIDAKGERTVDLAPRYPYRQFTTGAKYPDGLPAALLAEMDRDVISPDQANSAVVAKPQNPDADEDAAEQEITDEWHPPKAQLRYGGRSFEEWRQQLLTDLQPKTQLEAIEALRAFGEKGYEREVVESLSPVLGSKDDALRSQAFFTLKKIGALALPALLKALRSDDAAVRRSAVFALDMDPVTDGAVEALKEAVDDQDHTVRIVAARALAKVGASHKRLLPLFEQLAVSPDTEMRSTLMWALANAPGAGPGLVPLFVRAIDDEDWQTRRAAGNGLARIGPARPEVIEGIRRLVRDDLVRYRLHHQWDQTAGSTLGPLTQEEQNLETVAPVLVFAAAIMLPDPTFAGWSGLNEVLAALKRFGPKAVDAVPALTQFIDFNRPPANDDTLMLAFDALESMGPLAHDAVPALKAWTQEPPPNSDRDWESIRKHALKALENIK